MDINDHLHDSMKQKTCSVIIGTGSYIPSRLIKNDNFLNHKFYDSDGKELEKTNDEIIEKFLEITTISERRYVTEDLVASDIAYYAATDAINDSGIDKEDLDYLIVAHNFGDVGYNSKRSDTVPSLAARVKYKLEIRNPDTVAYDILFGCPGWLQAVIQADYFIKSGDAKKILVIGVETLSRVSDPHDRDSMLYSDGAGAVIFEAKNSDVPLGILSHKSRSDALTHSKMLIMDKSYNPDYKPNDILFLKMNGRKLYQYAIETVPLAIKACLDKCNIHLSEVNKMLFHQANGKLDDSILDRLFKLYGITDIPNNIMPMTISWLGNSSVATLPTILDLILKGNFKPNEINRGDIVLFASVGAGMNANAVVYKM